MANKKEVSKKDTKKNVISKAEQKKEYTDVDQLSERLSERLGAQVKIDHNAKGKGKIVIKYHSLDELDGILTVFNP